MPLLQGRQVNRHINKKEMKEQTTIKQKYLPYLTIYRK